MTPRDLFVGVSGHDPITVDNEGREATQPIAMVGSTVLIAALVTSTNWAVAAHSVIAPGLLRPFVIIALVLACGQAALLYHVGGISALEVALSCATSPWCWWVPGLTATSVGGGTRSPGFDESPTRKVAPNPPRPRSSHAVCTIQR